MSIDEKLIYIALLSAFIQKLGYKEVIITIEDIENVAGSVMRVAEEEDGMHITFEKQS